MALQGNSLWMTALGLAAPDQVEEGVHLRWSVSASVGFPPFGFDIYRRRHVPSPVFCMSMGDTIEDTTHFSSGDLAVDSDLPLNWRPNWGPSAQPAVVADGAAQLRITCQQPMREFRLTTAQSLGSVQATAMDGSTPVAMAIIPPPGGTRTLRADRFTHVDVTTEDETGFQGLCRIAVAEGTDDGWGEPLASLALPASWPDAAARLPRSQWPAYQPSFPQVLAAIQLGNGPVAIAAAGGGDPVPPRFLVDPTRLLLAAALDPGLARILGLYLLDRTAVTGLSYDYRVVGVWAAALSHEWICFGVSRGTPPPVPAPGDLRATAQPADGTLLGASAAEPALVALTWSPPAVPAAAAQAAPVRYQVSRQQPRGHGWTDPELLTTAGPVPPSSDPALPSYLDGPLPPGGYQYLVAGVDLFGREGSPSAPAGVTLRDEIAPPPPTGVTARIDRANGATEATVTWAWPADLSAQAGDAATFQVYVQTGELRTLSGAVTAVRAAGPGLADADTDLPPGPDYTRYIGGRLVSRGHSFPVTSVTSAITAHGRITVRVAALIAADGSEIRPSAATTARRTGLVFSSPGAAAGHFTLQADQPDPAHWPPAGPPVPVTGAETYQLTLPGLGLTTGPLTPVARAWFGVATTDQAGVQGPMSVAVPAAIAHTDPPPAPPAPDGPAFASRADYHGRSRCPLTIGSTEPGLRYDVLRALDATIMALAGADSADDAALLALAGQHDDAFTRLDCRDAGGQPLTGTGGALTYTDTLPGTGRNRFVYKVQATDLAGNRSALSGGLVVHLIDVVPPRPPVLTGVYGGDRQITLQWAANREPDLALYRLYRTGDPAAAADVRAMPLVAAFLLDSATDPATGTGAATDADRAADATARLSAGDGGLSYSDTGLPGGSDQYYRLVAVDTAGNASPASPALRGRPFDASRPAAPSWSAPADGPDGLALAWAAADPDLTCLVQRRDSEAAPWARLAGWLPRGQYACTDSGREPDRSYQYRLLALDARGRASPGSDVLTH